MNDLSPEELLQMYRASLALKQLHEENGSYQNYYEKRCEDLEAEIIKRIEQAEERNRK